MRLGPHFSAKIDGRLATFRSLSAVDERFGDLATIE
jgi:hypothetical protein